MLITLIVARRNVKVTKIIRNLIIFYSFSLSRYYNKLFLRFRPDLLQLIHRTRVKGTLVSRKNDANTEPNFYEMDPIIIKAGEKKKDKIDQYHESRAGAVYSTTTDGETKKNTLKCLCQCRKMNNSLERRLALPVNEQNFIEFKFCSDAVHNNFSINETSNRTGKCSNEYALSSDEEYLSE